MTHIILLDGKLWAFEPPEKPYQNRKEGIPTISKSWEHYDRAYSLALEKKLEVEKECYTKSHGVSKDGESEWEVITVITIGNLTFGISENEPIKWDGTVEIVTQRLNKLDGSQGASRKVCRLIAPVKEENKKDYFWKLDVLKQSGIVPMELTVKPGEKVVGLFWEGDLMNGTDFEKEDAEKYILPDHEYTVNEIQIGNWHSTVVLKEFPKKHFNSVHFGVKIDPCAYEEECQHPACNCPATVTPFKPCPKCRTRDFASCHSMQCPMRKAEPVPSEQENQEDDVTFTVDDMHKCFEMGCRFGRDMFNNPSNTEYVRGLYDLRKRQKQNSIRK